MDYSDYAHLYDAEYADYTEDIRFYLRWARRCPPPALELGCGTGRILFRLAEAGCSVTGIDNCPAMLERALQAQSRLDPEVASRVTLLAGDMRDFELDQQFGLIYLPFREFMHLHSEREQLDCLDAIHRHLHPRGRLIINLYNMDPVALHPSTRLGDVPVFRQRSGDHLEPQSGDKVYLTSTSHFQVETQLLREERFYDRVDGQGRVVERRIIELTQRWFFRWEMEHLLHRAYFRVESLQGGYQGQPFQGLGGEMIFVARPASRKELQQELAFLENKLARLSEEGNTGKAPKTKG